ncbi:transposase [Spirosoma endophyticum]|uniref:transposase n=1 Tax=Spirosoma endophyticum TaxID=662367 RepID=UPI000B82ACE8
MQPTRGREKYDEEFRARARKKLSAGLSIQKVSRLMGVCPTTLYKWEKRNLIRCRTNP